MSFENEYSTVSESPFQDNLQVYTPESPDEIWGPINQLGGGLPDVALDSDFLATGVSLRANTSIHLKPVKRHLDTNELQWEERAVLDGESEYRLHFNPLLCFRYSYHQQNSAFLLLIKCRAPEGVAIALSSPALFNTCLDNQGYYEVLFGVDGDTMTTIKSPGFNGEERRIASFPSRVCQTDDESLDYWVCFSHEGLVYAGIGSAPGLSCIAMLDVTDLVRRHTNGADETVYSVAVGNPCDNPFSQSSALVVDGLLLTHPVPLHVGMRLSDKTYATCDIVLSEEVDKDKIAKYQAYQQHHRDLSYCYQRDLNLVYKPTTPPGDLSMVSSEENEPSILKVKNTYTGELIGVEVYPSVDNAANEGNCGGELEKRRKRIDEGYTIISVDDFDKMMKASPDPSGFVAGAEKWTNVQDHARREKRHKSTRPARQNKTDSSSRASRSLSKNTSKSRSSSSSSMSVRSPSSVIEGTDFVKDPEELSKQQARGERFLGLYSVARTLSERSLSIAHDSFSEQGDDIPLMQAWDKEVLVRKQRRDPPVILWKIVALDDDDYVGATKQLFSIPSEVASFVPTKLHIFSMDWDAFKQFQSSDMIGCFNVYGAYRVEWLGDFSCNVVFRKASGVRAALQMLSRELPSPPFAELQHAKPSDLGSMGWRLGKKIFRSTSSGAGARLLMRNANTWDCICLSERPRAWPLAGFSAGTAGFTNCESNVEDDVVYRTKDMMARPLKTSRF